MKYLSLLSCLGVSSSLIATAAAFKRPLAVQKYHKSHNGQQGLLPTTSSNLASSVTRQRQLSKDDNKGILHVRTSTSLSATTQKFKNFDEVLDTYREEPVMVIFTAVNCGPCRLMKKELKQVSFLSKGKFKMFAVDTQKFPHVGSRFQIGALPCLLVVHDGEPLLRIEGVLKAEEVMERVKTITLI